jgi:BlaI family transcriptional regulator, penicillinase repressor
MSRKPHPNLTPAELELMTILWEHGPATVQMVVEQLPKERPLAYTTVQSVLNTLHRKGKVKRKLDNRAYYYAPAVSHARAAATAIQDLVKGLFGGSPELMVLNMLETRQLTPEKLRELEQLVALAEKQRTKEGAK